ncbi:hypothetical protein ABKN59_011979, partial [Abortiporus biennis]
GEKRLRSVEEDITTSSHSSDTRVWANFESHGNTEGEPTSRGAGGDTSTVESMQGEVAVEMRDGATDPESTNAPETTLSQDSNSVDSPHKEAPIDNGELWDPIESHNQKSTYLRDESNHTLDVGEVLATNAKIKEIHHAKHEEPVTLYGEATSDNIDKPNFSAGSPWDIEGRDETKLEDILHTPAGDEDEDDTTKDPSSDTNDTSSSSSHTEKPLSERPVVGSSSTRTTQVYKSERTVASTLQDDTGRSESHAILNEGNELLMAEAESDDRNEGQEKEQEREHLETTDKLIEGSTGIAQSSLKEDDIEITNKGDIIEPVTLREGNAESQYDPPVEIVLEENEKNEGDATARELLGHLEGNNNGNANLTLLSAQNNEEVNATPLSSPLESNPTYHGIFDSLQADQQFRPDTVIAIEDHNFFRKDDEDTEGHMETPSSLEDFAHAHEDELALDLEKEDKVEDENEDNEKRLSMERSFPLDSSVQGELMQKEQDVVVDDDEDKERQDEKNEPQIESIVPPDTIRPIPEGGYFESSATLDSPPLSSPKPEDASPELSQEDSEGYSTPHDADINKPNDQLDLEWREGSLRSELVSQLSSPSSEQLEDQEQSAKLIDSPDSKHDSEELRNLETEDNSHRDSFPYGLSFTIPPPPPPPPPMSGSTASSPAESENFC